MRTPLIERETVISWNEEEPDAHVWSASPLFQRKMERMGLEPYKTDLRGEAGIIESRYYRVPKRLVGVRLMRKMPNLTEEQRLERARIARERFNKSLGRIPSLSESAILAPVPVV